MSSLLLGIAALICVFVAIAPVLTAGAQCIAAFMMGKGIGVALGALAVTIGALLGAALLIAPYARSNDSVQIHHAIVLAAAPWIAAKLYQLALARSAKKD